LFFFYFLLISYWDTKERIKKWCEEPYCCCCYLRRRKRSLSSDSLVTHHNLTIETKSEDSESSPMDSGHLPSMNEIQMMQTPRPSTLSETKHDLHYQIQLGKTDEDLPTITQTMSTRSLRIPRKLGGINLSTPSGASEPGSMNFNSPLKSDSDTMNFNTPQKSDSDTTPIGGLPGGIDTGEFPPIGEQD